MFVAFSFGVYTSLIAYLIGEGESLSFLFFNSAEYSLYFGIIFWIFLSALTYKGIESLKRGEKTGVLSILILIFLMIILFWNKIEISNLQYNNFSLFYLPFGVTLFAFLGFSSIPEVRRILENEKKNMKKSIIIAVSSVLLIYLIFTTIVVGSQGQSTPELSTLALGKIFVILGMLTMGTSHLAVSTALIDTFRFDFYKSKTKSWIYTISPPLIIFILLYFIKAASFIKVIGISGVISGGITATLILLMINKAKQKSERKPEYSIPYSSILTWLIIAILTIGTILEIFNSL
jgi:amino acid permease